MSGRFLRSRAQIDAEKLEMLADELEARAASGDLRGYSKTRLMKAAMNYRVAARKRLRTK